MSFDLTNKVALVTGGSGVLGQAICKGLAQAGAKVVVLARTESKTADVVQSIVDSGGEALGVSADVLDKDSLLAARKIIQEHNGEIDVQSAPGKGAIFTLRFPIDPKAHDQT